jgi:hypothetical protein
MLVVLSTCKVPPDSEPPPPPPGGIRIDVTGYPASFFTGRICHYVICQLEGDPNTPAERIAEGTFTLTSGSGTSAGEHLEAGQYDLYIAVDTDSDGFTYSEVFPPDGDLHNAEMDITVNDTVKDQSFTLKTVAGTITFPSSSGDLDVAIGVHKPPNTFEIEKQVTYSGITNATSATYCIDVTDLSGSYYLIGGIGNLERWYDDANGITGSPPPGPVDVDNLQASYDIDL